MPRTRLVQMSDIACSKRCLNIVLLSSFIPKHILSEVCRWSGYPNYSQYYERVTDGQHGWGYFKLPTMCSSQPCIFTRSMPLLFALFSSCFYASKLPLILNSSAVISNIYSRTIAVPKYIPREWIDTTQTRLQQANISLSSLDQVIDILKRKALMIVVES